MRIPGIFLIVLIVVLIQSCQIADTNQDYIKVMTLGKADHPKRANKDIGAQDFLYYNAGNDSAILRMLTGIDPYTFETQAGHFGQTRFKDSLDKLIHFLKNHPDSNFQEGYRNKFDVYCGLTYYVEYRGQTGIHHQTFILDGNDTLENFHTFFQHLDKGNWRRKKINNSYIDADMEAVQLLKRMGLFDKIEMPYFNEYCDSTLDMQKLFGTWRFIDPLSKTSSSSKFVLVTFTNHAIIYERFMKGKVKFLDSVRITNIHQNRITFLSTSDHEPQQMIICKATDLCLSFTIESSSRKCTLNRISSSPSPVEN